MNQRRWWLALAVALAGCHGTRSQVTVLRVASWGTGEDDSAYAKKQDAIDRRFELDNPGVRIQRAITIACAYCSGTMSR